MYLWDYYTNYFCPNISYNLSQAKLIQVYKLGFFAQVKRIERIFLLSKVV